MIFQRFTIILLLFFSCISCLVQCRDKKQVSVEKITLTETDQDPGPSIQDSIFTALLQRKRAEKVYFFALGQEPGWNLDIDSSRIKFASYVASSMQTPWSAPLADKDTIHYNLETESGTLQIAIVQGACADPMSGQLYTHAVTVRMRQGKDKDFKIFKGCGTFVN